MEVFGQIQENIEELLSKGIIFYKFSKSDESLTNMFFEHFYSAYPENSIIKAQHSHGLSFCADIRKLLGCAMYGDQITQVIIDKNSPYFETAKQDYLKLTNVKDRRREPQPIIDEKFDIYDRKSSVVHYLYINNFTREQTRQIMKILEKV